MEVSRRAGTGCPADSRGGDRAWQIQDWRYGKQLSELARLHQDDLTAIGSAATAQQQAEQSKRQALEQRLATATNPITRN
ncbi:hypothetical protein QNM99_03935 [Pseudomonas sp. PCH446]